mmetsp:Transcript_12704/g.27384  ORF Transcript_12704/g.27384 Transcript_12704/m.27384 type:complete len:333 (-) Transcript_12704:788-1786(-)
MGNCINHSPSAATAQKFDKTEDARPCDERTIDTSSNTTISPPASPEPPPKADIMTPKNPHEEPVNEPASQQTSPPSSPQTPSPSASDEKKTSSVVEQKREEGQNLLSNLVVSGAKSGDIDWKSIISLAEDLHRREQRLLQSYNERRFGNKVASSMTSSCGSSWSNSSRAQTFFEKRRRRREMSRRRKLESVGSFCVNLHTYEESDVICRSLLSTLDKKEDELRESAAAGTKDGVDVSEDDDPLPLYHDISFSTSSEGVAVEIERPGISSLFIKPIATGSFLEAVSSYDIGKYEECASNSSSDSSTSSSSSSVLPEDNWDLMTIDEDATVIEW